MADPNDYQSMGLPTDVVKPSSPPGRGMLRGVELQVAILGSQPDVRSQLAGLRDFAGAMTRAGVRPAHPIERMPERIPMADLPTAVNGRPVLGLVASTLEPLTYQPEGAFLVSGPPLSGRSAAMRALAVSLRRWNPAIQLHLFCPFRRSGIGGHDLWTTQTYGPEKSKERAESLLRELKAPDAPPAAVFIEGVLEFATSSADIAMMELVKVCVAEGVFTVGEGEASTLGTTISLLAPMKQSRYGLAFGPDPSDGDRVFRTPFPVRLNRADFPPGRALFVHAGHTPVVGIGWVEEGG
jgi:S-DNA-T family DNA segregation ATPase FtsK/SpoIIIE